MQANTRDLDSSVGCLLVLAVNRIRLFVPFPSYLPAIDLLRLLPGVTISRTVEHEVYLNGKIDTSPRDHLYEEIFGILATVGRTNEQ